MNPPKATGQVVPEPEQRKEVCAAAAEALKAALAQLPCYDKVRVPSNATNDAKLRGDRRVVCLRVCRPLKGLGQCV